MCRSATAALLATTHLAQELEAERLARKAQELRSLGEFQAQQASTHTPPSFDYCPAGLPESAASLRSFAGEDPQFLARKKQQAEQLAGWCADAQVQAQAQTDAARRQAAAEHAQLQSHLAVSAEGFAAQEALRARAAQEAAAANLALAAQKRENDAQAASERAATHLTALIVDDGPVSGVPRTEFRGYTPQQMAEVLATQEAQRGAAAARRAAEADQQRSEAVHAAMLRKAQEKAATDVLSFQQQQRVAVAATVEAQRAEKERLAKEAAAVRPLPPHLRALCVADALCRMRRRRRSPT